MAEVQLHGKYARGRVALIDDADLPLVSGCTWYVKEDQRKSDGSWRSYAVCWSRVHRHPHRYLFMHQLLTGRMWADHKNSDGLDNRRVNLRTGTPAQNLVNRPKRPGTRSRYIGVGWHARDRLWMAKVGSRHSGNVRVVGYFKIEEDAARARDAAALEMYGEFARLNFPQEMDKEMIMVATFHQWLSGHETGPSDDPVAWLARQWKACEGNRPKVSSPTGIEKHLTKPAVAEQIFAGDPEVFIKGVHDAIADATTRYRADKAREQAGLPATSSGDTVPPAGETNPATGKPVAIVKQGEWIERPQADKFGSCQVCGWAMGVAQIAGMDSKQLTCAAGHVVNGPARPGESFPQPGEPGPSPMIQIPLGLQAALQTQLDRIELMLAAICATLGLPGDNPDALAGLIAAAAETDRGEAEALAMVREIAPAGRTERLLSDQLGPQASSLADFASWYGMADPAAQGGESDG